MSLLTPLATVAAIWLVAVITPGPNTLMAIAAAARRQGGRRVIGGIALGALIWGLAGAFGMNALFAIAPGLHAFLRLFGGAYLIFLGWRLLRGVPGQTRPAPGTPFRTALLTGLANPKSALFVAGLFAVALPVHPAPALSALVIATMVIISTAWYGLLFRLFTSRRIATLFERRRRPIERGCGTAFIGFGAAIMAAR